MIDLENRTVTLRGRELLLDDAEFDLLILLTTHRRKVVTPRTLLVPRWTSQQASEADLLLLSLRKKLEAAVPERHYIRIEP